MEGWPKPVRMILRGALDEAVRVLLADLDGGAGLQQAHLLDHVQQQVGDLVDPVRAIRAEAAQVDLGEIGVGAALGGGHAHLGRGGLVVELDPEALQQLLGALAGQRAVGQVLPVEGVAGAGRGGPGRRSPRCSARWSRPGGRTSSTAAPPKGRAGHGPEPRRRPRRCAPARPGAAGSGFARRQSRRASSAWRSAKRTMASGADAHGLQFFLSLRRQRGSLRIVQPGQAARRSRAMKSSMPLR